MKQKCILLVNKKTILLEGMESILRDKDDFSIVNSFPTCQADLARDIEILKPSVIIIDENSSFIEPASLLINLSGIENIRLVILNPYKNYMNIYDKREHEFSDVKQFIEAII